MSKNLEEESLHAILSLFLTLGPPRFPWLSAKPVQTMTSPRIRIVRALEPKKKPLTQRPVCQLLQNDSGGDCRGGRFVQTHPRQSQHALPSRERPPPPREGNRFPSQDKPNIDLEINFDYNSGRHQPKNHCSVPAPGSAYQPRSEGLPTVVARSYRCCR